MNIICVDDERLSLRLIENTIKNTLVDIHLKVFTSPTKAIDFASKNSVDVAFLGIDMYEMDGFTVTLKLREYNPNINIIFVTNYEQYALESYRLHVSGFVLKPITKEKILNEINNLRNKV